MSSTIIIILTLLIIIISISIVIIILVKKSKSTKNNKIKGIKGNKGESEYKGIKYSYYHFKGSQNAPPFFQISIKLNFPGSFKIKKETKFDKFFKKIGVSTEIKTYDKEFDEKFYISTDNEKFTKLFFSKAENRQLITEIYKNGFNKISFNGKKFKAKIVPLKRKHSIDQSIINRIVKNLHLLTQNLPDIPKPSLTESKSWKSKRVIAFVLPLLICITGTVLLIIGLNKFPPLDNIKIILHSLKYSIPAIFIFLYISIRLLRGRSTSHNELIAVFLITFFGFPFAGAGATIFLNGWLDKSKPVKHKVQIIDKKINKSKNSVSYYAITQSWRDSFDTEKIKLTKKEYQIVSPGKSKMIVKTKSGKLNFEWIMDYKITGFY